MDDLHNSRASGGDRLRAGLALQMVAAATGVPTDSMSGNRRRTTQACRARWLAMYLAHVSFGWTIDRVGLAFGLNRTTAAQACRWAEDERDRPWLDDMLNRLERAARDILDGPRCELPA
ncbi:helix-turn-helix domain-containing protein [Brevundimonas sp. FT23028]|uniref:helix-turn-helix domain-containing protein n=1 Tax=Brevundimonas sp. FT23028 TaxID=3393748 RepID=UPI003B587B9A